MKLDEALFCLSFSRADARPPHSAKRKKAGEREREREEGNTAAHVLPLQFSNPLRCGESSPAAWPGWWEQREGSGLRPRQVSSIKRDQHETERPPPCNSTPLFVCYSSSSSSISILF